MNTTIEGRPSFAHMRGFGAGRDNHRRVRCHGEHGRRSGPEGERSSTAAFSPGSAKISRRRIALHQQFTNNTDGPRRVTLVQPTPGTWA